MVDVFSPLISSLAAINMLSEDDVTLRINRPLSKIQ